MTPEAYAAINAELKYRMSNETGTHARRNRQAAKRRFLGWVAKSDPIVMPTLLKMCQGECPTVNEADIATVAQSIIDRMNGQGDWLAEAVAMQAEYRDDAQTTSDLRQF